jgi:hypothetical protein
VIVGHLIQVELRSMQMFKRVGTVLLGVVLGLGITVAQGSGFVAGEILNIMTGEPLGTLELKEIYSIEGQTQKFERLYGAVPMAPVPEYTVTNEVGTVTIFRDAGNNTQLRGTHKGVQFNTEPGQPSQLPFMGRNVGIQNGSKFIQFQNPKAVVLLANNYPAGGLTPDQVSLLNRTSPGCVANGFVKTIVVLVKPAGMFPTACVNVVVPLN